MIYASWPRACGSLTLGSWILAAALLTSCASRNPQLTTVHLVDVNGFTQTVTQTQRLEQLQRIDFLTQQPYQKVLRTWKDRAGQTKSVLTSYYASGRLMQYLEGRGGKAWGMYREWYENGQLRIQVRVSSGLLDFGDTAEQSWQFEGVSTAYDEQGHLEAQIPYEHGKKEGIATFYHPGGELWRQISYKDDQIDGDFFSWYATKQPLIQAHYIAGVLDGTCFRYWPEGQVASQEEYNKGRLIKASYCEAEGKVLAQVVGGEGERVIFGKTQVVERQTIHEGLIQGWTGFYGDDGALCHQIHVENDLKNGEEIYFYPLSSGNTVLKPKIAMHWHQGILHGLVRTWYPSGQLQSERQIIADQSEGPYLAYYPNGQVRIVEEYHLDALVSGDYFELNASTPSSSVRDGQGKAMIYTDKGQLEREIIYRDGQPVPTRKNSDSKSLPAP